MSNINNFNQTEHSVFRFIQTNLSNSIVILYSSWYFCIFNCIRHILDLKVSLLGNLGHKYPGIWNETAKTAQSYWWWFCWQLPANNFQFLFGVNNDFIKSHSSRVMTRKNLIKVLGGQMESIGYMKKKVCDGPRSSTNLPLMRPY